MYIYALFNIIFVELVFQVHCKNLFPLCSLNNIQHRWAPLCHVLVKKEHDRRLNK